eukprot:m.3102 g.3102  ORF g.3102 m.3102 type:complete len:580 (+) comp9051_c0_seq1:73-1812(+)
MRSFFSIMITASLFLTVWLISAIESFKTPNCTEVRQSHVAEQSKAKNYIYHSLKRGNAENDDGSRVCASASPTCCSSQAEAAFQAFSHHEVERVVRNVHEGLQKTFTYLNDTFIKLFHSSIEASRARTVSIFTRAYPDHFKDNTIFDPLYDAMLEFLSTRAADIDSSVTMVRDSVIIEAFKGLVQTDSITSEKRKCILRNINKLGESESGVFKGKLAFVRRLVQRAMNVSAALVVGIETGKRASMLVSELCPSESCLAEYARMSHCSLCAGQADLRPCRSLCDTVMPKCVGDLKEVSGAFNMLLSVMTKLMTEMENISPESAIHDIGTEFSFGAMNLATTLLGDVGKGIRQQCGFPPPPKRNKRSYSLWGIDEPSGDGKPVEDATPPTVMEVPVQLKYGRNAIVRFHGAFDLTVDDVCQSLSSDDDAVCWNGTAVGSHTSKGKKMKASATRQRTLMAVTMELRRATQIMEQWNNLDFWKTSPTKSGCDTSVNPDPEPVTDRVPDDKTGPECPDDDEDCLENGESGSGEPDGGNGNVVPAEPTLLVIIDEAGLNGGAVGAQSVVKTLILSCILLAAAWLF